MHPDKEHDGAGRHLGGKREAGAQVGSAHVMGLQLQGKGMGGQEGGGATTMHPELVVSACLHCAQSTGFTLCPSYSTAARTERT